MSSPLIVSICGEQSLVAVVVLSNQTVTIQTNFFFITNDFDRMPERYQPHPSPLRPLRFPFK